MSPFTTDLQSGVGIAICNDRWDSVVIPANKNGVVPRERFGLVSPGEPLRDVVERALTHVGFTPDVVGVTNHDYALLESWKTKAGSEVLPVSPTKATLAGLRQMEDRNQFVLQQGSARFRHQPSALLKIGPKHVTWATQNDVVAHRPIAARTIAELTPMARKFADFIGSPQNTDAVEMLGNRGWANAARFIAEAGNALPMNLTDELIRRAVDPKSRRVLASHICSNASAPVSDPFCAEVSAFMLDLFGRTIGHVSSLANFETLYVQYNTISAVTAMPTWSLGRAELRSGMAQGDKATENRRKFARIVLTGPRPQVHEAIGAAQLAAIKAAK